MQLDCIFFVFIFLFWLVVHDNKFLNKWFDTFIDSTNHQCTQLRKHAKNNILLIGSRKRERGDENSDGNEQREFIGDRDA